MDDLETIPAEILDEFLESLVGFSNGTEPHNAYGILLQDLAASRIGSQYVIEDEQGEQWISYEDMIPAILIGMGRLHHRIAMIERLVEPGPGSNKNAC